MTDHELIDAARHSAIQSLREDCPPGDPLTELTVRLWLRAAGAIGPCEPVVSHPRRRDGRRHPREKGGMSQ